MVDLTERAANQGQSAIELDGVVISMGGTQRVFSVMPFKDRQADVSGVLSKLLGIPLSQPGCMRARNEVEVIWTGLNQWFVVGSDAITGLEGAAVTDQSDAWAVLKLRGSASSQVLARLCPLDLRYLSVGQVARSEFAHMMGIIIPRSEGYDIWVMRSFSNTAWHHLNDAAQSVAAQSSLRR